MKGLKEVQEACRKWIEKGGRLNRDRVNEEMAKFLEALSNEEFEDVCEAICSFEPEEMH